MRKLVSPPECISITEVSPLLSRTRAYDFVKYSFDVLLALLLLILLSPLLTTIYLMLKFRSPAPAIFKQRRLTRNGRVFTMYKFRSMCSNAEALSGAVFASANDPRITRLGRVLRRTRLDELPQLYNVVCGDMSLVGPRPERPEMVADLIRTHPFFNDRLSVRAGLTGLAQVSVGYSSTTRQYRHKLACDRLYVLNRGVSLDAWILTKTIAVVWSGKGAC